jgi:DNA-binding transcriptional LysR family regulator
MLRDGRADVALLHRPFASTAGLDTEVLTTEGQVAVLPAGHPLSRRSELRLTDLRVLETDPSNRWPSSDGTYPDGPGPQVHNHEQLLQLIGLGRTMAVLPESVRGSLRGGHAVVPVLDARW